MTCDEWAQRAAERMPRPTPEQAKSLALLLLPAVERRPKRQAS